MLLEPFSKEETLTMPDFSNGNYLEDIITIKANPMLNPFTYCVSNKDINSLMKKNKKKQIVRTNSKKTKQSIKKVTGNSHPGGAAEKVRKSTAISK